MNNSVSKKKEVYESSYNEVGSFVRTLKDERVTFILYVKRLEHISESLGKTANELQLATLAISTIGHQLDSIEKAVFDIHSKAVNDSQTNGGGSGGEIN